MLDFQYKHCTLTPDDMMYVYCKGLAACAADPFCFCSCFNNVEIVGFKHLNVGRPFSKKAFGLVVTSSHHRDLAKTFQMEGALFSEEAFGSIVS